MGVREIRQHCRLADAGERLLEQAMQHFGLSARAHDRIRKVARTIADPGGAEDYADASVRGDSVPYAGPAAVGWSLPLQGNWLE